MRRWRQGKLTTRPRHSDPLTLPTVRLRGSPAVNGAMCKILRSAFDRGDYGTDRYTSVRDPELGTTGIHRLAFYRHHGWLPDGRKEVIRHRCDRPGCFEIKHLFVGPQRGNVVDDSTRSLPSINARKTHCIHGHEFTPQNTYLYRGARVCRECGRQRTRQYQHDQRVTRRGS